MVGSVNGAVTMFWEYVVVAYITKRSRDNETIAFVHKLNKEQKTRLSERVHARATSKRNSIVAGDEE